MEYTSVYFKKHQKEGLKTHTTTSVLVPKILHTFVNVSKVLQFASLRRLMHDFLGLCKTAATVIDLLQVDLFD